MTRPTLHWPARVHARATGTDGEHGSTLTELVVGMVLMGICSAIFTTAMVTLSRTSNQAQAITDATSQNNRAFQTLDRTARYASAISKPDIGTDGNWYVELRDTTTGIETCTQLRVNKSTNVLQSRTWKASDLTTKTDWTLLASGVTNGAATDGSDTQPFALVPAGDIAVRQRLKVVLVATSGPVNQRSATRSAFTLTAINSPGATVNGAVCQQAGRPGTP